MKNKQIKQIILKSHIHKKSDKSDIFIFSTPRSGSTLLLDMIACQPRMKVVREPLVNYDFKKNKLGNVKKDRLVSLTDQESVILKSYFDDLLNKREINSMRYDIFNAHHSWISNRSVVKILRATPIIDFFTKNFSHKQIRLIRHPIPTILSRIRNGWEEYSLEYLSDKEYINRYLSNELQNYCINFYKQAGTLERFTLSWCLENIPLLSYDNNKLITYEQLVLEGDKMVEYLSIYLQLSNTRRMESYLYKPSKSSIFSTEETRKMVSNKNKKALVEKWKSKIDDQQENRIFEILNIFDIDIYSYNNFLPNENYWL